MIIYNRGFREKWFIPHQQFAALVHIAHGMTLEKAKSDAERKYYAGLDVEESISLFKEKFKSKKLYANTEFYNWHTILTGSCDSGKNMWIQSKGIDMEGKMTVEQFLELTKNEYGSEIIKRLL